MFDDPFHKCNNIYVSRNDWCFYLFQSHPYPGGFLFIRFDDSGYSIMNNALKIQDSVCRHTGGYLMGIARSDKVRG